MIIDGKLITKQLLNELKLRVEALSFTPLLVDVVLGNDPVSESYARIKQKTASRIGIDFKIVKFDSKQEFTEDQVIQKLIELQTDHRLCGLIVQLPLPKNLDGKRILSQIDTKIDIDGLNPKSSDLFYSGLTANNLIPPTPAAILHILDSLDIKSGSQFVVMGQGELVGRPIAFLLQQRGEEVITIDISTDQTQADKILLQADILITGVGKPGIVIGDKLKAGVIVIDAGTSESSGAIKGDVDFESCIDKAKYITPVPGGVGPVTVAKLLENVLLVAETKNINK